jgi:hypothetical protein
MKRLLQTTKLIICVAILLSIYQSATACGLKGKIYVDTSICSSQGMAKLKLFNHTTVPGTTYTWQLSNDGGLSWNTMLTNSGKDTQNINPFLVGRMYRCKSTCPSGVAYSDTAEIVFNSRQITVAGKFCRTTATDNDSILLKAIIVNGGFIDSAYAKNFRWQSSSTNGLIWNDLPGRGDNIKVQFTAPIVQYRAFVSVCPLTGPSNTLPTQAPTFINTVNIGLTGTGLFLSDKDCVNDTARLSLSNVIPSLKNYFLFKWSDSALTGTPLGINKTDTFLKVKADKFWRTYTAVVKLCNNFNTTDSVKSTYNMNPVIRNFKSNLDCITQKIVLDYSNRDSIRKDFFTYWKRATNDTISFTAFNVPVDSQAYEFTLNNGTNDNYRVYSKFCPSSVQVLDSSIIVNIKLKIDTGQLKANYLACPNDSVYLKLNNYKDSSSFPLIKKWMYQSYSANFFENYTQAPMTDTTISFRMLKGWTSYKKSVSLCADKYAKTWSSTVAKTFLPFELIDTIACSGPMTVRVVSDTVKTVDYTGTSIRSNAAFTYQWLKSINNKVTSFIIPAAIGPTLSITQADKTAFFKRITKICGTSPSQDTTQWSNLVFNTPNSVNGKAEVFDEICLNDSVKICVVNFTPKVGDTATYLWQVSDDEITWTNLLSNTSNDSCIKVLVGPFYKYFRRLTYWCPSGVKDSSTSTPLIYVQNLPWCEGFTNQALFGKDVLFNCWRASNPVCNSYLPTYAGGQLWSRTNTGKTDKGMSNWGPPPADPKTPPGRKLDLKLITPAFYLTRGKIYRFSFWQKTDAPNLCWDSLYVTWGSTSNPCAITNKFGDILTKYSFDQFNKFWADFIPQDDGIYYFGINIRDNDQTTGQIDFDDVCLKEIQSCKGASPVKGATFAPSKIVDRVEEPSKASTYDKDKVTHQYCLHDTIMLTYNENNYTNNFDYYGMSYEFYKKREDADWKINDTFFRVDTFYNGKKKVAPFTDSTYSYDKLNCHMYNRNNYHVKNVLVTDTHTWYKIVATCAFDGKQYHSDSLLVNGTHSVPFCEDWESVGNISQKMPPACFLPGGNSEQIVGKVPSFASCPTCWAAYPQLPTGAPSATDLTLHSVTLPFRNIVNGTPQVPQLEPDQGWLGNNVVINCDSRGPGLTREILVMPAFRLYKNRGYRISFRWSDNRKSPQSPWGNASQDLDSLYLVAVKGNASGKTIDSFPRSKMIPGSLKKDLQSNILETGSNKYRTNWVDFMPTDTGTYYIGIVNVVGPLNGNPYRFQMDYFCIDTLYTDPNCTDEVKFKDPLRLRISPDGKMWSPGDTIIYPPGSQWCVGNKANIEIDFGNSSTNSWNYGNRMYWQRNTKKPPLTPIWTTIDSFIPGISSTNSISYTFTYKYQDFRLVLANKCLTKFDTVGPFKVLPAGGDLPWRENFETYPGTIPPCWEVYSPCRVTIKSIANEFNQKAMSGTEYMDMDYASPASPNCQLPGKQTAVPPGFGLAGGFTHRFSFWYKDNGISLPIDSIVAGWDYIRATDAIRARLLNLVFNPADVVKNSKTSKWRYYTAEYTPAVDTTIHCKVSTYNNNTLKRMNRTLFDDFMMKIKLNKDALVIAIDSPDYACDLKVNTTVKVSVMNIGFMNLVDIPVNISVDGGAPVSAIVPGTTVPNQVRTIYIPGVDLSAPNSHKVRAWTDVAGEEDAYDDTFSTTIIHNEMYPKPTDTVDSVCVCTNYVYSGNSANGMSRWYKTANSPSPFFIGDHLKLDSLCKDTCLYRSTWNGAVCYTTPQNFSFGAPQYSAAAGGLTFDNISQDSILLDSVMVYANTISTAPFQIQLTQFVNGFTVTRGFSPNLFISKLGRQWLPIKLKIPPGTDYRILYPGGASLAHLPGFIYIGSGCPSMQLTITGDEGFPAAPTSYKYFFNWKLEKCGCESERVKICFVTVPNPTFKLKDTNRVCSQPEYQICGPTAPVGNTYHYQWNTALLDTLICIGAKTSQWYNLTVTNEFGCKVTDSLNLIVDPSPNFTLGPDTSFCRYSPYTIKTGLNPSSNVVTWSDFQAGVSINILNPGTYIATAFNTANFCTAKDTINIIRRELPVFSLGIDRVFCGTTANIQTLAPNLPSSLNYTWGGAPGLPIISTLGPKKYWLDGVDAFGCKNTDTIIANLVGNPVFDLGLDTIHCGPSMTLTGPVGKYYYVWSTTSTNKNILVSTPGTYYLTVTDTVFGCSSVDSIKVSFRQVPIFDLGADVTKCALTHLISGPTGSGYIYTWKRKGIILGTGSSYIADTTGVYYLTVNNNKCYSFTDSVRITLKTPAQNAIDMLKDTFGCGQVNLRATSRTDYTKIQWGFPLSDTSNTVQVKKTSAYSVALTNECGTATKSVNIRIDTTPIANFAVKEYPDCMSVVLTNLSKYGITYIWQFGDNTTSTIEHPLHNYTAEGDYLVTLKTYNSCGFAAKTFPIAKRKIGCNLSIQATTLDESQVYIYPNPTKVSTQLIGVGLPNGNYTVSIKNLIGQTIYDQNVKVFNNEIDEKLDVAKFASGEYLVHISNDSESIVRKLQVIK